MKTLILLVWGITLTTAFKVMEMTNSSMQVEAQNRITNGKDADYYQFPYIVGLAFERTSSSNELFWCGGSLIGNEWVLTAAHCMKDVVSVTVYLGSVIRMSGKTRYTVNAKNTITHSGWDSQQVTNDIALIKIPYTSYTNEIKAVELPTLSTTATYEGETVVASGWGRTSDSSSSLANTLQWSSFTVISNAKCAKGIDYQIIASKICIATSNGVSSCKGDSGGPLVLKNSNVQIGICSFSSNQGCTKGYPAGFTRVSSFTQWIKDNTGIYY